METEQSKKKRVLRGKDKDLIFYTLMMIFPVVQFAVMYIGVNFNSILLAFKKIDTISGSYEWTFSNITNAVDLFVHSSTLISAAKNSLLAYVVLTFIGTPLGLIFSYYIYKKMPLSNSFRVILFLPSIISGIVMVTIFQFFVERAVPSFANQLFGIKMKGMLENPSSRYFTIIFYNLWVGFGTSVLMYSNGMSGISQEMVESAHLDGATGLTEFWKITLPMIYPTLSTFLITGIAGLFTNQIALYSFYGSGAPENLQTYGYYLYMRTKNAASDSEYTLLSAMGLLLTVVVVPLTLFVKWALEKFGPKED